MPTTFRAGDITGARTLVLIQAVACVIVGTLLLTAPMGVLAEVVVVLGAYWLVRGLATVGHAYVDPGHWSGKGLVAVLGITAGVLTLQAPVVGLVPIGFSIVLFLVLQALVTGAIEVVIGVRNNSHPLSILGVVNVVLGIGLLLYAVLPAQALTPGLGAVAVVGGLLSAYAAIRLPRVQTITSL